MHAAAINQLFVWIDRRGKIVGWFWRFPPINLTKGYVYKVIVVIWFMIAA